MIRLPFRKFHSIGQSASLQIRRTFATKEDSRGRKIPEKEEKGPLKGLRKKFQNAKESLLEWTDGKNDGTYGFERGSSIPEHCDVVVIGGGVMGSSIAYWLKQKIFEHMNVVVVERDPTYTKASTSLSVGGLRQQFSLEENIRMSLYGAEFIRQINQHLGIEGEPPVDPCFHPYGYLMLASESGAKNLENNSRLQNSLGAKNILLTAKKLRDMFPWLETSGIELGCLGLEKEGWFDPWSVLCAFKNKAISMGVEYVRAEAKGFGFKSIELGQYSETEVLRYEKPDNLIIETPEGERRTIRFAVAVIAAGAFSGDVARMANIGTGSDVLSVPLPVEPRKRYVYCFHCKTGPGLNTPLTIDPTGTYFRRDGLAGNFIAGRSPEARDEPAVDDLNVDHDYFNDKVWPTLARRVKAFEDIKVKSSWAGYYEYNTFDKNGIIGRHPYHKHLYFATGFSGHGIQQAPAVGRAISELIIDGNFTTIDLTKFGFERLIAREPMLEANIV